MEEGDGKHKELKCSIFWNLDSELILFRNIKKYSFDLLFYTWKAAVWVKGKGLQFFLFFLQVLL